jgi:hypothetical protein
MSGLGWCSPLPSEIGGGDSDVERIWMGLRDAWGKPGPGPIDGLEDLWRQSKARAIAFSSSTMERAAFQIFPAYSTGPHLAYYENIYGYYPGGQTIPEEWERGASVALEYHQLPPRGVGELEDMIALIVPDSYIQNQAYNDSIISDFGKSLQARPYSVEGDVDLAEGGNPATSLPNYSSDMVVYVRVPVATTYTERATVARTLNRFVSSWVDWRIYDEGA